MKKRLFTLLFVGTSAIGFAQMQIGNSNFETWETVSSGEEPTNWSSFLSASGSLNWAASDQCESSTDVRPGRSGTKSVKIFSLDIFGTIANGNVTVGRINMGNATANHPDNYNSTILGNTSYSEVMTDTPDSIVFWAKFTPSSGSTADSARISAIIHDSYAFRDPIDANSQPHTVATAIKNFAKTDGNWVRIAVPFTYSGPASTAEYILVTFASSYTPGGGSGNDQLWIDDMELIYNPVGTEEISSSPVQVVNANGKITFKAKEGATLAVSITNSAGEVVAKGTTEQSFLITTPGVYFVSMASEGHEYVEKIAVY
jgi:hypothetical protein